MFSAIFSALKSVFNRAKESLKKLAKPETASLAVDALSDARRSRKDLIVENAILRQQLVVFKRQVKRPKFTNGDRVKMI